MRKRLTLICLGFTAMILTGCGADGKPIRPVIDPDVRIVASPKTGVTLESALRLGIKLW